MLYRRKPETVEAFVFGPEAEVTAPSWFADAIKHEKVEIDRAINDGAVHVYGCTIQTGTGKVRGKNGDYIVRGADNSIFPVKAKIFQKQYERVN